MFASQQHNFFQQIVYLPLQSILWSTQSVYSHIGLVNVPNTFICNCILTLCNSRCNQITQYLRVYKYVLLLYLLVVQYVYKVKLYRRHAPLNCNNIQYGPGEMQYLDCKCILRYPLRTSPTHLPEKDQMQFIISTTHAGVCCDESSIVW